MLEMESRSGKASDRAFMALLSWLSDYKFAKAFVLPFDVTVLIKPDDRECREQPEGIGVSLAPQM
jgi:hypothetical protein